MSRIVKRTRAAAWFAGRRLARLLDAVIPAAPRKETGRWSDPEWFRFPPF